MEKINKTLFKKLEKVGFFDLYDDCELSTLIRACGDDFECIGRINYPTGNVYFQAYPTEDAFDRMGIACVVDCCGYETGRTPEEAVARLWLRLKEKVK